MLVLDANILVRAVLGRRTLKLIAQYASHGAQFCAPDVAFADASKYLPAILSKRGADASSIVATISYLRTLIEEVDAETYQLLERDARERLLGRDEEDWPILATAMTFGCGIWTEDADFFGVGVPVWTTNRVEILLKSQMAAMRQDDF